MKCDEVQPLHGPYLDSELDAKTTLEMQEHMATCAECARLFATEAKLDVRLTTGLRQGQRTTALWEQIERRVVAAAQSDARPRPSTLDPRPLGWLSTLNSQLSTLLWPHPKVWAGLAAVWGMILTLNLATHETQPPTVAGRPAPSASEAHFALRQKQLLMAELIGRAVTTPANAPAAPAPGPRSDRRQNYLNS